MTTDHLESKLEQLLYSHDWFMAALEASREVNPPDGYLGGGVIRNLVWDKLHGYSSPTPLADLDLAYFDAADLSRETEQRLEAQLKTLQAKIPWQVRNQAAVHLWYEKRFGYRVEPLSSIKEAISTWPETTTAVAVKLNKNDQLEIFAAYGLVDLFDMTLRRNPRRVTKAIFQERLASKQILLKWPRVRVIDE
jgi:uncharacterized protein